LRLVSGPGHGDTREVLVRCLALTVVVLPAVARAEPRECHVVNVELQPASRSDLTPAVNPPPQIVAWIERPDGTYVDTIFITKQTGTYGLGNRPGQFDFNSGPLWPYGRRITTFPVWAHRKTPLEFPQVTFRDGVENNLSHMLNQSSADIHYCRPMSTQDPTWDALTCASPGNTFTDKGALSSAKSLYPPRADLARDPGRDDPSVDLYDQLNPFDAVSQATPAVNARAMLSWAMPYTAGSGDFVMWVEVSKEFDHNATYSQEAYPPPAVSFSTYGLPYRGQPSVIYKVPFRVGVETFTSSARDYAGYGDPDGLDGDLRAPDGTISTTVPGSGALRFALISDGPEMFRVRVNTRPEIDDVVPAATSNMAVTDATSHSATVDFLAPGDDGLIGRVTSYEVRYQIGDPMTEATFDDAMDPKLAIQIAQPGAPQSITIPGLLPQTTYSVGIRALDDCANRGPLTVVEVTTLERAFGEVDACFIATAAYGSLLAADVGPLRQLRDTVLRHSVLGELVISTYYTFGPALAGVIGESEVLRATARGMLEPFVRYARAFRF
jgi:hypothetical protein